MRPPLYDPHHRMAAMCASQLPVGLGYGAVMHVTRRLDRKGFEEADVVLDLDVHGAPGLAEVAFVGKGSPWMCTVRVGGQEYGFSCRYGGGQVVIAPLSAAFAG
jgi:hypothetical protein